jgi:hypothetical protein
MTSKLAYIKHNLILGHSDLFKFNGRRNAEDDIIGDDINIED